MNASTIPILKVTFEATNFTSFKGQTILLVFQKDSPEQEKKSDVLRQEMPSPIWKYEGTNVQMYKIRQS